MDERTSQHRNQSIWSALVGVALVLIGASTLGFLVFISNSQGAEHLMIALGLAGSAMLSATAQALIFIGAWMVWKARKRQA